MSIEDERLVSNFHHIPFIPDKIKWIEHWKKAGFSNVINSRKHKIEQNEQDIDFRTDFDLSEVISPGVYDLLDEHEKLTKKYQKLLGFYVFRCIS